MADPTFSGVADAFSAFAGGGRLERDAYNTELKRMIDAKSAEAQMTERVQQAFMSSRQNKAQEDFMANPADLRDPNNINAMVQSLMAASGGFKFNDTLGALNGSAEYDRRNRLETADQTGGMTEANAIAHALQGSPELVRNVDVKGGIGLTGQYGDNAELASKPIMDALTASTTSAGEGGNYEREIQDWMRITNPETNQPYTREEAFLRSQGGYKIETDPISGNARIVNLNTGRVQEVPILPAPIPEGALLPERAQPSLYNQAPVAGGVSASVQTGLGRAASMFNMTYDDGGSIDAQQQFATAMNDMLMSMSVNAKMPVKEIERIQEQIDITPSWSKGGPFIRQRMISIDASLRRMHNAAIQEANAPGATRESKTNAQAKANAIRRFLDTMGIPAEASAEQLGYENNPGGITPEARAKANSELLGRPGWSDLTPDEQEELIGRYATDRSGGR